MGFRINKSIFKKKVVKDSLALGLSNMAVTPVVILRGFIVAKFLGPSDYGLLKSIELIQMLNKYGNLGFRQTAGREAGDLIGKGDEVAALETRNIAFSAEIVLSFLLFFAGLTSSLFFDDQKVSIMIILASAGLLASKIRGVFGTEAAIQKKFVLTSKISFFTLLFASIVVIITVPFLKIYAVLLTNIVVGITAIIFYRKYLDMRFSFRIERKELKRILKISLPLTIGTLILGSFKYAERILVITFLGPIALGFYAFGDMISGQFITLLKVSIKVRMQDIYEGLGGEQLKGTHKMVVKETALLTLVSILLIPIAWFALEYLIPVFLPKWEDGISTAQTFLFVMPLQVIPNYIINVLLSAKVNKQNITPIFQLISTILLVSGTFILKYYDLLTLQNFIILNLSCYAFYAGSLIVLYKIYFFNVFMNKKTQSNS